MNTRYSELLWRREWLDFRRRFLDSQVNPWCETHGEETTGPLHVHHKVYIPGRMPWEYDYSDLRILCEECHQQIHEAEELARNIIRAMPPWAIHEVTDFLAEIEGLGEHERQIAFARAKNAVRDSRLLDELPLPKSHRKAAA